MEKKMKIVRIILASIFWIIGMVGWIFYGLYIFCKTISVEMFYHHYFGLFNILGFVSLYIIVLVLIQLITAIIYPFSVENNSEAES
jgi:hypothetical protein